jgi:tetratricopeptide (TPR) repeat protein
LADALARSGKFEESLAAFQEAIRRFRLRRAQYPALLVPIADLATAEANLAEQLIPLHRYAEAEEQARAAITGWEDLLKRDSETRAYRFYLAISDKLLGQAQRHRGFCADAMKSFRSAQTIVTDPALGTAVAESALDLSKEISLEMAACGGR